MRAVILLLAILSAPAWAADPVALVHAQELKAQAIASNAAFSLCMGCAAAHRAELAAYLAQYLAQCQPSTRARLTSSKLYPVLPRLLRRPIRRIHHD